MGVDDYTFTGLAFSVFDNRDLVFTNFCNILRPLRRLCLSLDISNRGRNKYTEEKLKNLTQAFETAVNLETLEHRLSSNGRCALPLSKLLILLKLRQLTVRNFNISHEDVEKELLPWCFSANVKTLHLTACTFGGGVPAKLKKLLEWLFEKDMREESHGVIEKAGDEEENGFPCDEDQYGESDLESTFDYCDETLSRMTVSEAREWMVETGQFCRVIRDSVEVLIDGDDWGSKGHILHVLLDNHPFSG